MIIRRWKSEDEGRLRPLLMAYLREVDGLYDYLPTENNVDKLWAVGVARAGRGDPVLLAEDVELLGWTSWIRVGNPVGFDFRAHVALGMGTYVVPDARSRGVARQLHEQAAAIAKNLGIERVDRIGALTGHGPGMLKRDGWAPAATIYQRAL